MPGQAVTAEHNIPPIWNPSSRILILGSFPSQISRTHAFYYANPKNRFWRVMAAVIGCEMPENTEEKRKMLLHAGIALWDVVRSCSISGSSDASIREYQPNDLSFLTEQAQIRRIFTNGSAAYRLYRNSAKSVTDIAAVRLPSTSSANAACSLETLIEIWSGEIRPYLEDIPAVIHHEAILTDL